MVNPPVSAHHVAVVAALDRVLQVGGGGGGGLGVGALLHCWLGSLAPLPQAEDEERDGEDADHHDDGDQDGQQDGVVQRVGRVAGRLLVDPHHGPVDQLLQSLLLLPLLGLLDVQQELLAGSPDQVSGPQERGRAGGIPPGIWISGFLYLRLMNLEMAQKLKLEVDSRSN